jgi:site-specific DNA recombinase
MSGPVRVAVYCRVSSEEQAQSGTIQNQIDFAHRYCELHRLEIGEVYADDGVSGTLPLAERPAGRRLLSDAKQHRFELVLVYRIDRLARRLKQLLDAYEELQAAGVGLRSMTEPIDTSTPIGRFVFQLLGSLAELEREVIRERTELGRQRAIAEGRALGHTPMGYRTGEDGRLQIEPTEAAVVREIFEMLANGTSATATARALNKREIQPYWISRGYSKGVVKLGVWHHTTVGSIVKSKVYWTGYWDYKRSDGSIARIPAPVIVDPATAIRATQNLAANNFKAKCPGRMYLLTGIIRCDCGFARVGRVGSGGRHPYYICTQRRRKYVPSQCSIPAVRADLVEQAVWSDIRTIASKPGDLADRIRSKLQRSASEVEETYRKLREVEAEYDALVTERLQAQLRADRGEMTREELSSYLKAGVSRVRELERLRLDLAAELASRQVEESQIAGVESIRAELQEMVEKAETDDALKQKLIRALVSRITVKRGEERPVIEIEYVFSLGGSTPDGSTHRVVRYATTQRFVYRYCVDCGAPVYAPKNLRCDPCAWKYSVARSREWHRQKLGYVPLTECIDCGGPIPEPGRGRKRCPACSMEHKRKQMREYRKRRLETERSQEMAHGSVAD